MKIGIIGSGKMGGGLGKWWAEKGHEVLFSDTHDASHLTELATSVGHGARTGSSLEAVQFGEVVLLTVRWADVSHSLVGLGETLKGKTLISCINPFKADFSGLEVGLTTSGAEEVAKLVPGCKRSGVPVSERHGHQFAGGEVQR